MSDHSRRSFLRTASITAAAAGAAAVVPAATSADAEPVESGATHDGPFAVWVKNARTGEITVMVGETEVVHHDKALAAKLARIAGRAE